MAVLGEGGVPVMGRATPPGARAHSPMNAQDWRIIGSMRLYVYSYPTYCVVVYTYSYPFAVCFCGGVCVASKFLCLFVKRYLLPTLILSGSEINTKKGIRHPRFTALTLSEIFGKSVLVLCGFGVRRKLQK